MTWTPPEGPVAIVGAGPGLGLALARRFGRSGAPVGLVARGAARLDDLVTRLAEDGVTAAGFPADVAHEPSLRLALDGITERYGAPAVAIANASAHFEGTPSTVDPEDVLTGFRIGALSAVVTLQHVLPAMLDAARGTVLVTGGGSAVRPSPAMPALSMQKAAVRAYALAAAKELAPRGIHVATLTIRGTIAPGTAFDPDLIAEEFWRLHVQPPDDWVAEAEFRAG